MSIVQPPARASTSKSRGSIGGLNDERIYNPDAGNLASGLVQDHARAFMKRFDDRFANPQALNYDPTKDRCLVDPNCDLAAKQVTHYNWLYGQCDNGNRVACGKLRASASSPTPSMRYPNGDHMNVPYYPGHEP